MPHHALGITLTRPLSAAELRHVSQAWPLAPNHNVTRLMALVGAKTPERAATACASPPGCPPDVITTHYTDAHRQVLLNLVVTPLVEHPQVAVPSRMWAGDKYTKRTGRRRATRVCRRWAGARRRAAGGRGQPP